MQLTINHWFIVKLVSATPRMVCANVGCCCSATAVIDAKCYPLMHIILDKWVIKQKIFNINTTISSILNEMKIFYTNKSGINKYTNVNCLKLFNYYWCYYQYSCDFVAVAQQSSVVVSTQGQSTRQVVIFVGRLGFNFHSSRATYVYAIMI